MAGLFMKNKIPSTTTANNNNNKDIGNIPALPVSPFPYPRHTNFPKFEQQDPMVMIGSPPIKEMARMSGMISPISPDIKNPLLSNMNTDMKVKPVENDRSKPRLKIAEEYEGIKPLEISTNSIEMSDIKSESRASNKKPE